MFDLEFYLKLVNGAFGSSISLTDLPEERPRILRRIEEHLKENPLPNGAAFNHYRPARYFSDNIHSPLVKELSKEVLDRFQAAFDAVNALLPT